MCSTTISWPLLLMAQSTLVTQQYLSDAFVESCGAIIFDLKDPKAIQVCLVKVLKHDQWMLAKGRRNIGESRADAALREACEETGFSCQLLPVRMPTRAPDEDDPPNSPDKAHLRNNLTEPFVCTVRHLGPDKGVKIIWWYIAVVDKHNTSSGAGEDGFESRFFPCKEAIEKLHFENDRNILRKAISLVEDTMAPWQPVIDSINTFLTKNA